ncbi:uncharacterized protein [Aristolochia californica]|uniref:uncharacterized protein n=1 Tax=Aristolochia californica TaxID=171875 RepID=UPI0035D9F4F9
MACEEIHAWTVSTLVGAFLDLALAYLLLCGAALAFFASKFLNLFGLRLPCPCNCLFRYPAAGYMCLQRALVDGPTRRISSVQMGVKTKFPFDSIWTGDGSLDLKLLRDWGVDGGYDGRLGEQVAGVDGEASCSSISCARMSHGLALTASPAEVSNRSGAGFRSGVRGRRGVGRGPSSSLRRRRRVGVGGGRFSPISSSDNTIFSEKGKEMCGESSVSVDSGGDQLQCEDESYAGAGVLVYSEPYGRLKENFEEKSHYSHSLGSCFDRNDSNTIRILEHALEEEQVARAALYLELEKERSAAATAADEAMGMICRLQKEKASIEMEARQYQREIEEKSVYDEEEMNILKEILLRREKEKLVLEKEVEMYHQMILSDEKREEDSMMLPDRGKDDLGYALHGSGEQVYSSLGSVDDPMFILQKISESIEKNGTVKHSDLCLETKHCCEKQSGSHGHVSQLSYCQGPGIKIVDKHHTHTLDECGMKFQEKGMVSTAESWGLHSQKIPISGKMNKAQDTSFLVDKATVDYLESESHDRVTDLRSSTSKASQFEAESSILDVHVIDDETKPCDMKNSEKDRSLPSGSTSNSLIEQGFSFEACGAGKIGVTSDNLRKRMVESEANIYRSRSDVLVQDNFQTKALVSALRGNSVSVVDHEKLKLQTEVGRLTERLKLVQKGREKLAVSIENKEKERSHELQLLEEITSQLQEIRSLKHPVMAARRVSLPPPSSKVGSKKRRCRSVSIHGSTD